MAESESARLDVEIDAMNFEDFATSEREPLIALGLAALRNRDDALDVAQEALIRAHDRWETVEAYDRPDAWVRRVAINLITDRLRRRRRIYALLTRLASARTLGSEMPVVQDDTLWREVARLPERQRSAVLLRYVDDMAIVDIGHALDIPDGTVKSDLARARQQLRERLGEEDHGFG